MDMKRLLVPTQLGQSAAILVAASRAVLFVVGVAVAIACAARRPLSEGAIRDTVANKGCGLGRAHFDVSADQQPQRRNTWAAPFSAQARKSAEPAVKPGSVVGNHSSRRCVTAALKQPTRRHRGSRHRLPIWSCSRWGLPYRPVARLVVRSYRTVSPLPRASCDAVRRSLSVALSVGSRRPGVTWHRTLWSPDFPRHPQGMTRLPWPTPRGDSTALPTNHPQKFAVRIFGPRRRCTHTPPLSRRPLTQGAVR